VVALWLAVLLGLGSLALPDALAERGLAGAGVGAIMPSGLAGRAVIALGAGLAGALAGWGGARAIQGRRAAPQPAPRPPLRVREVLGAGLAAGDETGPPLRRRALTIPASEPPALAELVGQLEVSLGRRRGQVPVVPVPPERALADARLRAALAALQRARRAT